MSQEVVGKAQNKKLQFSVAALLLLMVLVSVFFAGRYFLPEPSSAKGNNQEKPIVEWDSERGPVPVAILLPITLFGNGTQANSKYMKTLNDYGAQIIAVENEFGVRGEIDKNTRCFVVDNAQGKSSKDSKLFEQARKHSVPIISAKDLLDFLRSRKQ